MKFIKLKNLFYVSRLPIAVGISVMYLTYKLRVKNNIEKEDLLRCGALALVSIFGCVYNNYIDYEMDKKYKEDSNLLWDRDVLTKKDYALYSLFLASIILIYNITVIQPNLIIVGLYELLIAYLYSRVFKKTVFKNISFVLTLTTSMYLEGYIMNYDKNIMNYTLLISLFYLPREIVLDINDYKGDKEYGLKTLPILFGKKFCLYLIFVLYNTWAYLQYIFYQMKVIDDYSFCFNMYIYGCYITIFMYYYNKDKIEYGYCMKKICAFYFTYHFMNFYISHRITFVLHVYLCTRYLSNILIKQ